MHCCVSDSHSMLKMLVFISLERRSKSPSKLNDDGLITDKDDEQEEERRKREELQKRLMQPACENELFKRTSELELLRRAQCDRKHNTKTTEQVVIPTRKALLQIATLKPGDLFVSRIN